MTVAEPQDPAPETKSDSERIMEHIAANPGCSIISISTTLEMKRTHAEFLLDGLVKAGMIRRTREDDGYLMYFIKEAEPSPPPQPKAKTDRPDVGRVPCPVEGCPSKLKPMKQNIYAHLRTQHKLKGTKLKKMLDAMFPKEPTTALEASDPPEPPIDDTVPPLSSITAVNMDSGSPLPEDFPECTGDECTITPSKEDIEKVVNRWVELGISLENINPDSLPPYDPRPVATLNDSNSTMTGSYDIKDLNIFRTDREWLSDRLEDLTRGARERNLTVKVTMEWSPLRADVIITGARP